MSDLHADIAPVVIRQTCVTGSCTVRRVTRPRLALVVGLLVSAVTMTGCGSTPEPPPANAGFDYQIGGAYPPPDGVEIVSRDRQDPPAADRYNICYVNGMQAQTEDEEWWLTEHPGLVLHDAAGEPVKDTEWNELILDISTTDTRAQLAAIVGEWISDCGRSGFQAVEVDNLDSYARSDGLLTEEDAVRFVRLLSDRAHAADLALGQKNASDLVPRRSDMGTDFAVVEECSRYDECGTFTKGYDTSVFVVEYRRGDFDAGCRDWPGLSIVLRDKDVVPVDVEGYARGEC